METTAEVRPTKVATMKYRKNSIEEDEQEIEELEKIRAGEEETEKAEKEPDHPEERTFKKRYGDLRRHLQKKEDEHRKELMTVREQISNLTKTQVRLPKTDEEIDDWANKYPDVAKVVETIATKKARENSKQIEEKLAYLSEKEQRVNRKEAETELGKRHPDYDELRSDPNFHEWAERQPKMIQQALYDNEDDYEAASKAIDLFKLERERDSVDRSSPKEAARSVNTRRKTREPNQDPKAKWSESKVRKLSGKQWDKHHEEIEEAIASGNFEYDETGAAR
tara:strand:- start:3874 stop:4713 length:840 start_codon:yes stop_codon:yes gene_type:complete